MSDARYSFAPPRPLSERERHVTRWIIENGDAPAEEKETLLGQLAEAKNAGRCPCGCASVDFSIGGVVPSQKDGLRIVGDFISNDRDGGSNGLFVFSCEGLLAGLEIYQLGSEKIPTELPEPENLTPFEPNKTA